MSGRALYEYKKELFDDRDDDANDSGDDEPPPPQENNGTHNNDKESAQVEQVAAQVQSELFLEGDDEDLDHLEDD